MAELKEVKMSAFTINSVTVQGLNVIAKLIAGDTLEFTRIAVGDGAMPSDKTPLTVTDLTNKLFDVDITSVLNNGNASATVTGVFNNENCEVGFFYRELGLFAIDPDTEQEILYCYGNAGADAEWISPSGGSSIIEKEVKIETIIGNAANVTAQIKSGIYPTVNEVKDYIKNHNTNLDAHTDKIASQSEAEAQSNQNNKKFMTPLRVYQAIVAYFTQFLAAAVFTGIVKAVAPAAASNDNSVPTTSWVRTCFESMAKTVAEIRRTFKNRGRKQPDDYRRRKSLRYLTEHVRYL